MSITNQKYFIGIAFFLLLIAMISVIPQDAYGLTQASFAYYNHNPLTARYPNNVYSICGTVVCKPGAHLIIPSIAPDGKSWNQVTGPLVYRPGIFCVTVTGCSPQTNPSVVTCVTTLYQTITITDIKGNQWILYCGNYSDVTTQSDLSASDAKSFREFRMFDLLQRFSSASYPNYLPDSAFTSTTARSTMSLLIKKVQSEIDKDQFNFAVHDLKTLYSYMDCYYGGDCTDDLIDVHYEPQIAPIVNDIKLIAIKAATP